MNATSERPRIDWISAVLALATSLMLTWLAWERLRPPPPRDPPQVGATPPPLRLLDLETSEPLLLLGLRGKVVWITFWSAGPPADRALLEDLANVTKRLRERNRFTMVAAAVDRDRAEAVRAVAAAVPDSAPVYLATAETQRAYGITPRQLPLHFLIDDDGHVGVIAQGYDHETLSRLAHQAEAWLDALEPFGGARFATLR